MLLQIPPDQLDLLRSALNKAGIREIGGQIFGQQLAVSYFSATNISFQKRQGTFARFVVDLMQAALDAIHFYSITEHKYDRFNYIGEWHSHPSFALHPSLTDIESMRSIVNDPEFKGNFAILMIVRLDNEELCAAAWLFDVKGNEFKIKVEAS